MVVIISFCVYGWNWLSWTIQFWRFMWFAQCSTWTLNVSKHKHKDAHTVRHAHTFARTFVEGSHTHTHCISTDCVCKINDASSTLAISMHSPVSFGFMYFFLVRGKYSNKHDTKHIATYLSVCLCVREYDIIAQFQ